MLSFSRFTLTATQFYPFTHSNLFDNLSNMKSKETTPMGFWEHFGNFLWILLIIGIILIVVGWLFSDIGPFLIVFIVFTVLVYPVIKIKERIKKRKQ